MKIRSVIDVCSNSGNRHDPRKAVVDVVLRSVQQRGSLVFFDGDSIAHWPAIGPWGRATIGGDQVWWVEGDALVGGWWDHQADGRKDRGTANWYNGYLLRPPPKRTTLYANWISYDGKHRTHIKRIGGIVAGRFVSQWSSPITFE